MTPAQEGQGRQQPVERYRATSGRFVGLVGVVAMAVVIGYVVVAVHSLAGLRLATGALFFGVLVWVTQLRPRVMAFPEVLRLQNSLRDVDVPLAAVDDVHVGRMLTVWVGKERYVCIAIGVPLRKIGRPDGRRGSSARGWERLEEDSRYAAPPRPPESEMGYPQFVESRIATLAEEARRRARGTGGGADLRPRKTWAWPWGAALAVTGAAFVVSLLL